mmetsp:Transcript_60917/g.108182  ORF Transcript_60917/g.108182 Transcript_60917/m.108182 type:complete len:431 (-) Transcript_60917:90-1382(-)|eukprot:CAMPEP_0197622448 /NCGR_PEP_ID=MMETSP1338-20131121/2757_1 /TAXON_ID=43686 ORGANISM="Pelagodinium beii, Strain RCC1491" /NCGR_SAMPLE_ID=MMETSP1338 /ASSEMBLY_ACC=CAM_ASM_000754 /LENGTH=430 /DNA_ID=CAMNT_0043192181 /DNA_START=67 /DNA_END=1359 /DNA_ORIENTATION=-
MASSEVPLIHLLATSADSSHEPQVFRMRLDQPLRRFISAYAKFRQLSVEAESQLQLWTPGHGELNPGETAGVYGLSDGDQVLFSSPQVEAAGHAAPVEETTTSAALVQADKEPAQGPKSRGRKPRASPKASPKPAPKSKAKPAPKGEALSIPEDATMRSTAVKAGPAKGWHVTAWLQDNANDKSVCWRALSPGKSRSFDVAGSRRSCPDLQTATSAEVYSQIFRDVRPKLFQRLNGCRRANTRAIPTPSRARAKEEMPSEPKRRKTATYERLATKQVPKAAAPEPGDLATQLFVGPSSEGLVPEDLSWKCGCKAHLKRHSRCVLDKLQPGLVHLRDYMLIGRGESCDMVLDSQRSPNMISRCHAVLNQEDGGFAIIDQGSMNGVLVNDVKVSGRQALAHGDVITFGVPQSQPEFDYIFECRAVADGDDVW